MEAKAIAKRIPISPFKLRLVVDTVRGKNIKEAMSILENLRKRGAKPVQKCIMSAVANATFNNKMNEDKLYIKEITIDQGPTRKGILFDSRGRIGHRFRRSSHINVVVAER